jgi:hypothetical protein
MNGTIMGTCREESSIYTHPTTCFLLSQSYLPLVMPFIRTLRLNFQCYTQLSCVSVPTSERSEVPSLPPERQLANTVTDTDCSYTSHLDAAATYLAQKYLVYLQVQVQPAGVPGSTSKDLLQV